MTKTQHMVTSALMASKAMAEKVLAGNEIDKLEAVLVLGIVSIAVDNVFKAFDVTEEEFEKITESAVDKILNRKPENDGKNYTVAEGEECISLEPLAINYIRKHHGKG